MNDRKFAFRQLLKNSGSAAIALFALALMFGLTNLGRAEEWLQWRGPMRDGSVPAANAPKAWPESFHRVWRVEVGEGYSSPVVQNGRAFVHARRDPDEIVMAIDLAMGKVVWQQQYPAPFKKSQYAPRMAKGPYSTPLLVGGRLITLGATAVLSAWDTEDGRQIWSRDYAKAVDTSKLFCGTAASPAALGESCGGAGGQ